MANWRRIDVDHYTAKLDSGHFDARRIDGRWTLWFQPNLTRGFMRKPGSWSHLAAAKRRAEVLNNDYYLQRS